MSNSLHQFQYRQNRQTSSFKRAPVCKGRRLTAAPRQEHAGGGTSRRPSLGAEQISTICTTEALDASLRRRAQRRPRRRPQPRCCQEACTAPACAESHSPNPGAAKKLAQHQETSHRPGNDYGPAVSSPGDAGARALTAEWASSRFCCPASPRAPADPTTPGRTRGI